MRTITLLLDKRSGIFPASHNAFPPLTIGITAHAYKSHPSLVWTLSIFNHLQKKNPTIAFKGNTAFHVKVLVALSIQNFVWNQNKLKAIRSLVNQSSCVIGCRNKRTAQDLDSLLSVTLVCWRACKEWFHCLQFGFSINKIDLRAFSILWKHFLICWLKPLKNQSH